MTDGSYGMRRAAPPRVGRGGEIRESPAFRVLGLVLSALAMLPAVPPASAQNAERRGYVLSSDLRHDLAAHQFDAEQYEGTVNGIAAGLASGNLAQVLERAEPTIRVTDGAKNTLIAKEKLGALGQKLLTIVSLRDDIMDDQQTIVRGDEIGLARGTFWINQTCVNQACTQKKTSLVTINLP